LFRFLNPKASLRISGGREIHLRSLQAMGLYVANSIFIGDYLTAKGQPPEADLQMIQDLGFEIEGDVGADLVSARNEIETGMSPRAGTRPALTVELK